jgi:peptide/nickel transport system substrate-binding protein
MFNRVPFTKGIVRGACALTAVLALTAGAVAAEKTLMVGVGMLPDSLGTRASSFAIQSLQYQTFDPLVKRGKGAKLTPALAVRWEPVDATTWRFYLRKGVKWHDGVAFTAADVKDSLDYALDPKVIYGSRRRISQVSGSKVVDDHTIDIMTKKPFPTLILGLSDIPIQAKHHHEKVGAKGMAKHPLGTGPFVFSKWVPGDRYELTANKNYWGGAPKVDKIVLRQIPEGSTRVASLLAGEVHIAEEIPVDLIPKVEQTSGVAIDAVESTVGMCFTMDTRKPPFDNPKVRLAMDYAIDKPLILKEMLKGKGSLLKAQLLTSNTFGHNPNLKARPFDPAKAKQLLKEAGYENGFTTSITTRSGKYLSDVDIANATAGMLLNVGIKASVNVVEGGVFTKMVKAHDMGPIHMVGWYSLGDGDLASMWFTDPSGRAYWKDDEYEKLFVDARSTVDRAKREKAYHRMMEILREQNPAVYMFGLPTVYGKSSKLSGWWPPSDKVLDLSKAELK